MDRNWQNLIIDSKVSLNAYVDYFNAETDDEKTIHLKRFLQHVDDHIRSLSNKNYQKLYQIILDHCGQTITILQDYQIICQNNFEYYM